ncbi:MAG: helix-turn-helix domain-containing protein [Bacillus sp. (in: Bacteria)]|nr:helix-turn-helix domain-containing protein [Bacillus sp. (in: firmicutes)]MCM1426464.1 helix-turn-helix domain-containing protein [Eubacterium sp.]
MKKISNRLRYTFLENRISFLQAAKELGVSRDLLFDYTNPDYPEKSMQVNTLIKIADYFGKDKYYFCNEYHKFLDIADVGVFLYEARTKRSMTQKQFADFLGVSLDTYKKYEEGKSRLPMAIFEQLKDEKE